MKKSAIAVSIIALLLVAHYFLRAELEISTNISAHKFLWYTTGPLLLALAAFKWPRAAVLRWAAFLVNAFHALVMLFAFGYMVLHVSRPPSFASAIPVALFAIVMLLAPLANAIAMSPGVWQGANNSFKPKPLRGSA